MSWRDRLLPASFRGVKFFVDSADFEVGRRLSIHQYANRDEPYIQDHGKEAFTISINAYIIANFGNNFEYFLDRDRLIAAFQRYGAGILVTPYYGIRKVQLSGKAKITTSSQEGGICRISATFIEVGKRIASLQSDFKSITDRISNIGEDQIGDNFETGYSSTGVFLR